MSSFTLIIPGLVRYEIKNNGRKEDEFKLSTRYTAVFNAHDVEGMPEITAPQNNDLSVDDLVTILSKNMHVQIFNENDSEFDIQHFTKDGIEINGSVVHCRPMVVGDLKESFFCLDRAFEVYHSLDKESQEKLWPALALALDSTCNACYELGFECAEEVTETEYYYWFIKSGEK